MQRKGNCKGLTLIELMIMLTIIVILTLISVPLFSSIIKNYRLSATADSLFNYLQYAKSEAIKRNSNVYVSFGTGNNWCYGINVGSACNCAVANSCGVATVTTPQTQQLTLSTTGLTSNALYFDGTRGGASTSGTVTFTLYGGSYLITISIGRLGSLQMCSTGISGYTAC